MNASQRIYVVGKVIGANIRVTEGKEIDGKYKKGNTEYSAFLKLPNGTAINLRKKIWESDKELPDFVKTKVIEFEDIVEKVKNKETVLLSKFISPNKEDKMWDWLTSYENNKEQDVYTLDGFGSLVKFTEEGENLIIHQKNRDVIFENLDPSIEVTMFVQDTYEDVIVLTDGEEDYPNILNVKLKKEPKNPPIIGQGYKFTLSYEKGGIDNTYVEEEVDFDQEAKTGFLPDTMYVKSVGKIDEMVLDDIKGGDEIVDF